MKNIPVLLLSLIFLQCSNEILTVKATVSYIEPFPFVAPLGHHIRESYKQPAWIKLLASGDSLAVLFDYNVSDGDDVSKKINIGDTCTFILRKMEMPMQVNESVWKNTDVDSSTAFIRSLPDISLVDSSKMVIAGQFWLVLKMEKE